jgi:transposase-like protein
MNPNPEGEGDATVMKIVEEGGVVEGSVVMSLDDLVREGARRMLAQALDSEVDDYLAKHAGERDERGRAIVTRNGKANERALASGAGVLKVEAPRVRDRGKHEDGTGRRFTSTILPPYMRKSPKLAEVLPVLYLRGLSTGDFNQALPVLLGKEAAGLSASSITRLTQSWEDEYRAFQDRDLSDREYVYIWADGIHFRVRLEEDRLCTLVLMGVRRDGTKELITVVDGYRESTESWAEALRDLTRRGMKPPMLAIGDGALGFWAALGDVWPETREQRCWVHKLANVLDKLPKRVQSKAKQALHEIMNAECRKDAEQAANDFERDFGAKYPKATKSLTKDLDRLLTFYDFPAEHWRHIRTTNAIESSFATVRLRQRVTKGAGNRMKALTMAFKLLEMAQIRWRRINGHALLEDVCRGETYIDGIKLEDAA